MGDTPQMQNDEVQSGQSIHKLGHGTSGNRRHQRCFCRTPCMRPQTQRKNALSNMLLELNKSPLGKRDI